MVTSSTLSAQGRYIIFEGPPGVGKSLQIELLAKHLRTDGYKVRVFASAGSETDRATIVSARNEGYICLVKGSPLSGFIHEYYGAGTTKNYAELSNNLGTISADQVLILDATAQMLLQRLNKHEGGSAYNLAYLEQIRAGYLWEARQRQYPIIYGGDAPETVHESVWNLLHGIPQKRTPQTHEPPIVHTPDTATPIKEVIAEKAAILKDKQPETSEVQNQPKAKANANNAHLGLVTNTKGNVYAFTEKVSPETVAAVLAQFSKQGSSDLRTLIANNHMPAKEVIDTYGSEFVEQLASVHVVIEHASNLLISKLEQGRLAAYIEQSNSYTGFDQKDLNGKYHYLVPEGLPSALKKKYQTVMDSIFETYANAVHKLTDYIRDHSAIPEAERNSVFENAIRIQACEAMHTILPVASQATVAIHASAQALESLITQLQSDELTEAQSTGEAILHETRKLIPALLEGADKPDQGGAMIAYKANRHKAMQTLATRELPQNQGSLDEDIQLVDFWPRNELDLLPHMLYEYSNMSLRDIKKETAAWSYDQKMAAFRTYMGERLSRRQKPGRALEIAHYSWDLLCDFSIFRDLQRHRMIDAQAWQELTPRYGFDMPELVEKAGLEEEFEHCFDLSAELYSEMQAKGFGLEAQYATLLGHRMRWKVTYNAREAFRIHELGTNPQEYPSHRKFVRAMHEKIAEVHPLLADAMIFVNKSEDEALTHLAVERYTQFKLNQAR